MCGGCLQDQERQLAALLSMQDLSGASLLSSAEAQGSSNLIYILKTLQVHAPLQALPKHNYLMNPQYDRSRVAGVWIMLHVRNAGMLSWNRLRAARKSCFTTLCIWCMQDHGGMNPQRLLQQLQAAMKESPMQQVLLMHMLQESLSDADHGQGSKRQVDPSHACMIPSSPNPCGVADFCASLVLVAHENVLILKTCTSPQCPCLVFSLPEGCAKALHSSLRIYQIAVFIGCAGQRHQGKAQV